MEDSRLFDFSVNGARGLHFETERAAVARVLADALAQSADVAVAARIVFSKDDADFRNRGGKMPSGRSSP
jgi:hypothetical protein